MQTIEITPELKQMHRYWFRLAATRNELGTALTQGDHTPKERLAKGGTAVFCVYRANRFVGVKGLLKGSFDFERVTALIWYVPTILLMPGIMLGSYAALHLMGVALPTP